MSLNSTARSDTDALLSSLGKPPGLCYIDIQGREAERQALARWPMLAKLRHEWAMRAAISPMPK
jgi:hypothetical protein